MGGPLLSMDRFGDIPTYKMDIGDPSYFCSLFDKVVAELPLPNLNLTLALFVITSDDFAVDETERTTSDCWK